ncbi:MAG: endonuclease V [candidate division Zixibacteria bacterium]|nr:endonuclease V [candidate division Zixibacteria bacterium]
MDFDDSIKWPTSQPEAHGLQEKISRQVTLMPMNDSPRLIAAVDTAYGFGGQNIYASATVTSFPELEEVEQISGWAEVKFPYAPDLLFFREGPVMVDVLSRLQSSPDVLIIHGHGIAHPRQCGVAGHIGVLFDLPTIGCCRRLLDGHHHEVAPRKGSYESIVYRDKEVGVAYRSKDNVKPIFISPAHLSDLKTAQDIIVRNLRGFRLPEPLRMAHSSANAYKRYIEKGRY